MMDAGGKGVVPEGKRAGGGALAGEALHQYPLPLDLPEGPSPRPHLPRPRHTDVHGTVTASAVDGWALWPRAGPATSWEAPCASSSPQPTPPFSPHHRAWSTPSLSRQREESEEVSGAETQTFVEKYEKQIKHFGELGSRRGLQVGGAREEWLALCVRGLSDLPTITFKGKGVLSWDLQPEVPVRQRPPGVRGDSQLPGHLVH